MKLVMIFKTNVKGTTKLPVEYTLPFEYESKEKFIEDFSQKVWKCFDNISSIMRIAGLQFNTVNFIERVSPYEVKLIPPTVLTVEEWFESYKTLPSHQIF